MTPISLLKKWEYFLLVLLECIWLPFWSQHFDVLIAKSDADDDDDGTYAIIMVHQFNAQHHPELMVMFNLL